MLFFLYCIFHVCKRIALIKNNWGTTTQGKNNSKEENNYQWEPPHPHSLFLLRVLALFACFCIFYQGKNWIISFYIVYGGFGPNFFFFIIIIFQHFIYASVILTL